MKTTRKKAAPVSREEQHRLVMECRTSGLTDRAWCLEHDINPETFRNWVKRLRNEGVPDILLSRRKRLSDNSSIPMPPEIVKLPYSAKPDGKMTGTVSEATLELVFCGVHVRATNEISPELFLMAVQSLKELPC